MRRIPISIKKIKVNGIDTSTMSGSLKVKEFTQFLFTIEEKGQEWARSIICDRDTLQKLKDEIDIALSSITTAETLNISEEEGRTLDEHYKNDALCVNCPYKLSFNCKTCLFVLQSPLERKLYIELRNANINFYTQYGLDWKGASISIEGKSFDNPHNNFNNVLTVVDFYIEIGNQCICVYTDGHTYHERIKEQAVRNRIIDRKLKELGYIVRRYTRKEVNENPEKIIKEIKEWIGYC